MIALKSRLIFMIRLDNKEKYTALKAKMVL